jgi:hypothetical protein
VGRTAAAVRAVVELLLSRVHPAAFEHHLREAIALNRDRAPRYAALSGGASHPISYALIASEYLLLPVARWFDRRAAPYHEAGVPLLEDLFVPMASAPAFGSIRFIEVKTEGGALAPQPSAIRQRVAKAYRAGSFAGAAPALAAELDALRDAPLTDCLLRHLLESIHRLATIAPHHIERCGARGLPSPAPLLAQLFWMHLWGLAPAAALDRRARPLQLRGIPILAQDLPPIPAWPPAS